MQSKMLKGNLLLKGKRKNLVIERVYRLPVVKTKENVNGGKRLSRVTLREEVDFEEQPRNNKKTFQRSRDDKHGKSERKCFRCGDPNHLIGECPKPPRDKNQRAFVGGSWSDSGEEDDEKVKDETCLVAHASSKICLGVDLEPDEWIKDSGCSKYITGNRKLFSTYKAYNGGSAKSSFASVLKEGNKASSLMGKIKNVSAMPNLYTIIFEEGFQNIKITYLGGMWVLLELDSIATKEKFLNHTCVGSWFTIIKQASNSFESDERIIWVSIKGLPVKAWITNSFRKIALLKGRLVE
ncbi:alpha/beta hydrolases superfamily protein [Tanacetum coccineum]